MNWTESTPINTTNLNNLETRVDQAVQAVTDAKTPISAAIVAMGQAASAADSFSTLSNKIKDISKDANAAATDVLSGKTFYQGGNKKTGTIADNSGNGYITPTSIVPAGTTLYVRIPKGAYLVGTSGTSGASVEVNFSDPDFLASNILSGVDIFGIVGTTLPRQYASGTGMTSSSSQVSTVTGLTFTPNIIVWEQWDSGSGIQARVVYVKDFDGALNGIAYRRQLSNPGINGSGLTWTITSTSFSINTGYINTSFNWKAWS